MFTFYFSPEPKFTGDYSHVDKNLICTTMWYIQYKVRNQLEPLIGERVGSIFKDLQVEFVDKQNFELRNAGAIGLAYENRNLNCVPAGLGNDFNKSPFAKTTFQAYTGIIAMELTHSVIWRLKHGETGSLKYANDVIHWLYNEGKLKTPDNVSQYNLKYFGSSIKNVVPDVAYGWANREEIMAGIKSGKYKEGKDKYFSDPNGAPAFNRIASSVHELEHIRNWLKYGSIHHD